MIAATFLAIFFVPLFFYWLTERKISEQRKQQTIKDEIAQHHEHELNAK
jgi:HAE1 family hydrophobic/amphiphilic exporter-1/multidrug efflux pump